MQHVTLKKPHDFGVLVESLVTGNKGELALAELAINPTYEKGSDQQAAWDFKAPMGKVVITSFFSAVTLDFRLVVQKIATRIHTCVHFGRQF